MLYTIAIVLVALWLFGLVSSYTMGGFIHILLVVAVVMILVNFISGRRRLNKEAANQTNWRFLMNTKTIIAVSLVALGIVVLAYSGITFKTPGKPVDVLGVEVETTHTHFIPPVVGALALVGGIVLLVAKPRQA